MKESHCAGGKWDLSMQSLHVISAISSYNGGLTFAGGDGPAGYDPARFEFVRAADDVQPDAPPISDPVFRPSHYTRFTIEPMTFAMANGLNGCELNVVKYMCRALYKGNPVQDYDKAIRCLEMLKETHSRNERVKAGEDAKVVWKDTL